LWHIHHIVSLLLQLAGLVRTLRIKGCNFISKLASLFTRIVSHGGRKRHFRRYSTLLLVEVYAFQFSSLQLISGGNLRDLMKVLAVSSFGLQTQVRFSQHVYHCTSQFLWSQRAYGKLLETVVNYNNVLYYRSWSVLFSPAIRFFSLSVSEYKKCFTTFISTSGSYSSSGKFYNTGLILIGKRTDLNKISRL
jgi:hypothetical protein